MAWKPSQSPVVQARWRARVDELEASGESVRVAAGRFGCSAGSLSKWRIWLRRQPPSPDPSTAFVQLRVQEPDSRQTAGGDGMVVELANGRRVFLGPGFQTKALKRLVTALDRP